MIGQLGLHAESAHQLAKKKKKKKDIYIYIYIMGFWMDGSTVMIYMGLAVERRYRLWNCYCSLI